MNDIEKYQPILTAMAKRNGCKYDIWYGESWAGFLSNTPTLQIYTCFICKQEIYKDVLHPYNDYIIKNQIADHGWEHLKESGLLVFL